MLKVTKTKEKLQQETELGAENSLLLERFYHTHKTSKYGVAEMLGVTSAAVDHWATGRRDIPAPIRKIFKICDKYSGLVQEFKGTKV